MTIENRNEKFIRIAETRMSRIFSQLNLISNLSIKKNYSYTPQEVDELFNAFIEKKNEISAFFNSQSDIEKPMTKSFTFSVNNNNDFVSDKKHDKFIQLAESRVNKIFTDMNLIANLSNKKNYTYTAEQIDELFDAYIKKVHEIELFFKPLCDTFSFSK